MAKGFAELLLPVKTSFLSTSKLRNLIMNETVISDIVVLDTAAFDTTLSNIQGQPVHKGEKGYVSN